MLKNIEQNRTRRLLTALGIGFTFGFLLQKGGATDYEVIVNQLLLRDFTVLKIILSAILTGMIGIYSHSVAVVSLPSSSVVIISLSTLSNNLITELSSNGLCSSQ